MRLSLGRCAVTRGAPGPNFFFAALLVSEYRRVFFFLFLYFLFVHFSVLSSARKGGLPISTALGESMRRGPGWILPLPIPLSVEYFFSTDSMLNNARRCSCRLDAVRRAYCFGVKSCNQPVFPTGYTCVFATSRLSHR